MSNINDVPWATGEIDEFLHVTAQVGRPQSPGVVRLGTAMRGPATEAAERAQIVEQILDRVLPAGWRDGRPETDAEWTWLREQASRGKAQLERADELADRLGDDAPRMNAGALHPWAWDSGAPFWRSGHFHQAVMQAAIRVNAETQAKLERRDVGEVKLFQAAFSVDAPKAGQPRLRLMEDDGSETFGSIHRGARALGEALYSGIRNPGSHTLTTDAEQQLALEQLAAFSLLARWVDGATVERS